MSCCVDVFDSQLRGNVLFAVSVISGIFDVAFYHRRMIAFRNRMCYEAVEMPITGIRRGRGEIARGWMKENDISCICLTVYGTRPRQSGCIV